MAGYKQRIIRLTFPELADDCWVDIINPKMISQEMLPNIAAEATDAEKAEAGMAAVGTLVVRWNVWDVTDDDDNPAVLTIPKDDPSVLSRIPLEIVAAVGAKVAEANPQTPSTPTSDSTS